MTQYTLPHELSFTDRASYIAWRAQWRQQYAELTAAIRHNKHELKRDQRENNGAKQHYYQIGAVNFRSDANGMLDTRAHAKRRAARLSLEAHQQRKAQQEAA